MGYVKYFKCSWERNWQKRFYVGRKETVVSVRASEKEGGDGGIQSAGGGGGVAEERLLIYSSGRRVAEDGFDGFCRFVAERQRVF